MLHSPRQWRTLSTLGKHETSGWGILPSRHPPLQTHASLKARPMCLAGWLAGLAMLPRRSAPSATYTDRRHKMGRPLLPSKCHLVCGQSEALHLHPFMSVAGTEVFLRGVQWWEGGNNKAEMQASGSHRLTWLSLPLAQMRLLGH